MDRRRFLELPLYGLPLLLAQRLLGQDRHTVSSMRQTRPVVVSTWESGFTANKAAWPILRKAGKALDAVEAAGRAAEESSCCSTGLGSLPDRDGRVTLDSCIMNGNGDCGAVSFLERIKYPVSVARKVMETTPHVLLSGIGAQKFALQNEFPLEDGKLSPGAEAAWKSWLERSQYKPSVNIEDRSPVSKAFAPYFFEDGSPNHDTIGTIALDAVGKLAGMVTTSGLAFKMHGRVGDSPIIGAGLFVDNEVGAATSSGIGEEVIRICGTHTVIEQMRAGRSPEQACREAVRRIAKRTRDGQVGFIALSRTGDIGAYAVRNGFSYTVTSTEYPNGKAFVAKSLYIDS